MLPWSLSKWRGKTFLLYFLALPSQVQKSLFLTFRIWGLRVVVDLKTNLKATFSLSWWKRPGVSVPWEAEAGGLKTQGLPAQFRQTLSQKQKVQRELGICVRGRVELLPDMRTTQFKLQCPTTKEKNTCRLLLPVGTKGSRVLSQCAESLKGGL